MAKRAEASREASAAPRLLPPSRPEPDWLLGWARERERSAMTMREAALRAMDHGAMESRRRSEERQGQELSRALEGLLSERLKRLNHSGLLTPGFEIGAACVEWRVFSGRPCRISARCVYASRAGSGAGDEWESIDVSESDALDFERVWERLSARIATLDAIHSGARENPSARALIDAHELSNELPESVREERPRL